jgi:hypothetical protein
MTHSTLAGDVLAWATLLGITAAGCWTTGVATVRAYKALKLRGWSELALAGTALAISVLLFLGGWLIVDVFWGLRKIIRRLKRLVWAWAC